MTPCAPGMCGARRVKQSTAVRASPPGVGTQSTSRMTRPWTWLVRAATSTNLVPPAALPSPSKCSAAAGSARVASRVPVGIEQPELAGLVGSQPAVELRERGEDVGVGEVAVAGVEVVVAAHRPLREVKVTTAGEAAADGPANQVPHQRMRKFRFDAA